VIEGFNTFNTCPTGSKHERGILAWNKAHEDESSNTLESGEVYNLPFGISSYLSSSSWIRYIPFCPPSEPDSLDGSGADTNALEPKQPLGHAEPSQIIIGVAMWVLYSLQHAFYGFSQKTIRGRSVWTSCPLLKTLYCDNMVEFHMNFEVTFANGNCMKLDTMWTFFREELRYMRLVLLHIFINCLC